jgi:hypothetical protein
MSDVFEIVRCPDTRILEVQKTNGVFNEQTQICRRGFSPRSIHRSVAHRVGGCSTVSLRFIPPLSPCGKI